MTRDEKLLICARAAHEACRAYSIALGDTSISPWDEAPTWQTASCLAGVEGALAGRTPKESHDAWMKRKLEEGWAYGPIKSPERKTHPCLVPYNQLPPDQRVKDHVYLGVVRSVYRALEVL